ncbi:hypothetical protein NIES25_24020 [Nostoc linckia NIES-25]|nr:hypothetical protein NIES25_24020 [Nostoc linckia NIES-25]
MIEVGQYFAHDYRKVPIDEPYSFQELSFVKNHHFNISLLDCGTSVSLILSLTALRIVNCSKFFYIVRIQNPESKI